MAVISTEQVDEAPKPVKCEGWTGSDGFSRSTQLPNDIMALMENAITTDNFTPQSRFGFDLLNDAAFSAGKVQGLAWFDTPSTTLAIAAVNGAMFKWDNAAKTALAGYTPTSATTLVEMVMGLNKLYIVDGTQELFTFDGVNFTKILSTDPAAASTSGNPPKGASIALWHSGLKRLLLSGVASVPDVIWESDVLDAGEGKWDWANHSFRAGAGEGDRITALFELPGNSAGDYVGVGKGRSIKVYFVPAGANSMAEWICVLDVKRVKVVGRRALVNLGNEVHVFTREGVRSVGRMEANGNNFQIEPPLSRPMQTYIDRINWQYASKINAIKYENFVIWFVPLDGETEPNAALVFNQRFNKWCGIWTGIEGTCGLITSFNDLDRLVIGDTDGKLLEWQDYTSEALEATFQDGGASFTTKFRIKSFDYGETESMKDGEFYWLEASVDSQGTISVSIVLDETVARTDTWNLAQVQNQLPLSLPFNLAVLKPSTKVGSLIGLENFKEQYFELSCAAGKFALKRFVAGAFVNPMITDAAA